MIALISFVIAVVGISIQIFDAFPQHREARRTIAIMGVGIFLGAALSSLLGAKYEVTGNVDRRFALLYAIVAGAVIFGGAAVVVKDVGRRQASLAVAACFGAAFVITGIAIGIGASPSQNRTVSSDELVQLARQAEQAGQYDRAIDRLTDLEMQLGSDQAREAVEKHIRDLQARQTAPFTKAR